MMPLGISEQLAGLLSTTMMYCSLGTSHRMACDRKFNVGKREEEKETVGKVIKEIEMSFFATHGSTTFTRLTKTVIKYLKAALQQVFACDDVRDFCFIQAMGDGLGSESGIHRHHCEV